MSIILLNFIIIALILLVADLSKSKSVQGWLFPMIFIQLLYLKTFVDINSVPDLVNYQSHYLEVRNLSVLDIIREKAEFGYFFLCKLCYSISTNFHFFLFVYNIILLFLYYFFMKRRSVNISLSIIFFLLIPFNGSIYVLRQHLAIAILLLSYSCIVDRKYIKFLLLIIIAMTFHRTAIVFLPLYFVYNVRNRVMLILAIISVTAVALWIAHNPMFFVEGLSQNENYVRYLNYSEYSSTITGALIFLLFLLAYVFIVGKKVLSDASARLYLLILIIATIICFVATGLPLIGRLVDYYKVWLIVIIPFIAKHIRYVPFRLLFVWVVIALEFYIAFLSSSADDYLNMVVPTVFELL